MSPELTGAEDRHSWQLDDLVRGESSVLGRLVAICEMRDLEPLSARDACAAPWVQQAVRRLHHQFFARWLRMTMQEQIADLTTYLWRIGAGPDAVAKLADDSMALAPEESMDDERGLFAESLTVLYTLFFRDQPCSANRPAPATAEAMPVLFAGGPVGNLT